MAIYASQPGKKPDVEGGGPSAPSELPMRGDRGAGEHCLVTGFGGVGAGRSGEASLKNLWVHS